MLHILLTRISPSHGVLFEGRYHRVPHRVRNDEPAIFQVLDLKQLPDHRNLEKSPDAAGHDDEHAACAQTCELVQSREEIPMPICSAEEIVRRLEAVVDLPDGDAPSPNARVPPPALHSPLA